MAKKYAYWISSGKYTLIQKMSIVLSGLLSFMMLARLFSPEQFGIWGLFMVIASIVETLRHALIKNGFILFYNNSDPLQKQHFEDNALLLNLLFSILISLIFYLGSSWIAGLLQVPDLANVLRIYVASIFALIPFTHREFKKAAQADFKSVSFLYFVRYLFFLLAVAVHFVFSMECTLNNLAVYYGMSILIGFLASILVGETGQLPQLNYRKQVMIRFLAYGKYVLGTNLFSMIFRNTDSFLISRYFGTGFLGLYNSSMRIINFAETPTQIIGDIMYPKATQLLKSGSTADLKNMYEKTVAASLSMIFPFAILVYIFPEIIINILAGKQYLGAVPILQTLVIFSIMLPFVNQFGNMMDATKRPHINTIVMAVIAVLNIGNNFLWMYFYGSMGTVYALLSSYILLFIAILIILNKILGVQLVQVLKNMVLFYPEYYKIIEQKIKPYKSAVNHEKG